MDVSYNISKEERNIIASVRDTIKVNVSPPWVVDETTGTKYQMFYETPELRDILQKMNFKSGKESIRLHTIIEYRDKAIFALDYSHTFIYFLFVFKYFTIIIHDKVTAERHTTRTLDGRAMANRYRGILEQFDKSGL